MRDIVALSSWRSRFVRTAKALTLASSYRVILATLDKTVFRPVGVLRREPERSDEPDAAPKDPRPIPPIIFQTWKTRQDLPGNFSYWRSTFLRHNPSYAHVLWDDADNRRLIEERFSFFLPVYDWYPREIFRADIIRFFFLFEYGGIYADLDTECLSNLDDMRSAGEVVLGRMGQDKNFSDSIPNAIMASSPRQLFWLLAIVFALDAYRRHSPCFEEVGPEVLTGPYILKSAADYYLTHTTEDVLERCREVLDQIACPPPAAGKLQILHRESLFGLDWTNPFHRRFRDRMIGEKAVPAPERVRALFPGAHMVTYWTHSW